jgi:hypothetical protein
MFLRGGGCGVGRISVALLGGLCGALRQILGFGIVISIYEGFGGFW